MRTEDYDWLFESTPSKPVEEPKELRVGDEVRVKSIEWYDKNKDSLGYVHVPEIFVPQMAAYCGGVYKIKEIVNLKGEHVYKLEGTKHWNFSKEMLDLD